MTKKDLIETVAARLQITQEGAGKAVAATLNAIISGLSADGTVALTGFGTFRVREKPAHEFRNPRTGEKVMKEAGKLPVFKAGKEMREAVR